MKKIATELFILLSFVFICGGTYANDPSFNVIFNSVSPVGISSDGSYVATQRAIWHNGQFSYLDPIAPDTYLINQRISGNGQAVSGRTSTWPQQACIYVNEQTKTLGFLPGMDSSSALGINYDGSVVVGYSFESGGGPNQAFRWENDQMVRLNDLPGGQDSCMAVDVSADGTIIVGHGRDYNYSASQACRWVNGQPEGLGVLNGFIGSYARSISSNGSYIVGYNANALGTSGIINEGFIWHDGQMESIGFLPGNAKSLASDVSNNGIVVGSSSGGSEDNAAILWDSTHGIRNLKDVLLGYGLTDVLPLDLTSAIGISDDGTTIVGSGKSPYGYTIGWMATIPEPATITLLSLGGLALMRKRRL